MALTNRVPFPLLLIAIGLCYIVSGVTANPTHQSCETELATLNLALLNNVKNDQRNEFEKGCESYLTLINSCRVIMNEVEILMLNDAHKQACESEKIKKWLESSGSALQSSWLFGVMALLVTMLRM